jgi:periplasmic protein TonB
MSAASLSHPFSLTEWQPGKKIGPLAMIIFLHIALLYILSTSSSNHTVQAASQPREVFATFIQPEPAPTPAPAQEIPKPSPPKPKTVPVVKKAVKPLPKRTEPAPEPAQQEQVVDTPVPTPASTSSALPSAAAPSAAPAISTPAPPKTISGVEYIQRPEPHYPPSSKRMGEEGKVTLRILVNEKGRPEKVEIQKSSGFSRLDDAAKQAAMSAVFKPYMEDGRPVSVYAIVPINFSIQ